MHIVQLCVWEFENSPTTFDHANQNISVAQIFYRTCIIVTFVIFLRVSQLCRPVSDALLAKIYSLPSSLSLGGRPSFHSQSIDTSCTKFVSLALGSCMRPVTPRCHFETTISTPKFLIYSRVSIYRQSLCYYNSP